MYFLTSELDHILQDWGEPSAKQIHRILAEIRTGIAEHPTSYRNFGGYWQQIKPLLYARKRPTPEQVVPALPAALAYRDLHALGTNLTTHEETLYHLWERGDGRAELISVYDPAMEGAREGQLDLFINLEEQEQAAQAFLTAPQDFLPRTWKQHGDQAQMDGDFHRAVRCYKRSALLSQDAIYRGEMWLAMGLALEAAEHHRKALLCFENAYEKAQEGWILGHIAHSWQSLGRIDQARYYYQEALQHMPGNPEYQAALTQLDKEAVGAPREQELQLDRARSA
ncbi:hypothetical protein [Spirochaeta africana]|nr:hypothetical protein [Spirochaeta africana]